MQTLLVLSDGYKEFLKMPKKYIFLIIFNLMKFQNHILLNIYNYYFNNILIVFFIRIMS